ncbi:acyl-CoA dehydrogenase [Puia sp.]|jgi:alkylation response protein AidB-like acyl-CoA dehydrogenase|uniref:acyl-CoA dehydrogenase n=1 Tax=Puia sp. TaxID=2045100 RepID=UPI002F40CC09
MTFLSSPDSFLPDGATGLIREHAAAAEQGRDLHPAVLELIYREGWFRLLVPQRWGGRALPLPQLVRLEEGLAFADGAVGWTVTLCSGAGWFAGFFPGGGPSDEDGFDQLFADERLCIAGSGSPSGEARVVEGGYHVSGRWSYASGVGHATAYTANCVVWKDGAPLPGPDGQPVVRPFLFLPGEVRVHDDWKAMGLVATGSHGFSVEGLVVPAERMFVIEAAAATDANVLYRYPFLTLAEVTLAANLSGMGLHFLDCCAEIFALRAKSGRVSPGAAAEMERLLAAARSDMGAMRGEFYRALDRSWAALEKGTDAPGLYGIAGSISHELVAKVREWVGRLYPYAGLGAARVDTAINRVWRDLNTAGQHPLLVF